MIIGKYDKDLRYRDKDKTTLTRTTLMSVTDMSEIFNFKTLTTEKFCSHGYACPNSLEKVVWACTSTTL